MSITSVTLTNDDGTTLVFVPKVDAPVHPTVSVPLGTPVVLTQAVNQPDVTPATPQ